MTVVVPLLTVVGLVAALLPVALTLANLGRFRPPPGCDDDPAGRAPGGGTEQVSPPRVSVLVPARNEEGAIEGCARAVLASRGVELELVVLDDGSTDGTAEILERLAAADPRVRVIRGRPLPEDWCGKQHAAAQLAEAAAHDTWVFIDADVRLAADAVRRSVAFLDASGAALASGFPRQETGAVLDWLLLPLIHFILLGYLPLARSRADNSPGLAAGCGQLFVTRRADYARAGGHAAIRRSLHDGIKLPRAYRRAGLKTDVFDASGIASCRMYASSRDAWNGLAKNATEGVGSPATIVPFTILLAGGGVLPVVLIAWGAATGWRGFPSWCVPLAILAAGLALLPRVVEAVRFRQSLSSAAAHPLAVLVFLAIQWTSLVRRQLGWRTTWRGRSLEAQ